MLEIEKERLAPLHFEALRQKHRADAEWRVPDIVFRLYLCNGTRKNTAIEKIAAQAMVTYPSDFQT